MSHQSVLKIQVQEHQWTTLGADPSSITNRRSLSFLNTQARS